MPTPQPTTPLPSPTAPVRDDAALRDLWGGLLAMDGPPRGRTLHLTWLQADGTPVPLVVPLEDLPAAPERVVDTLAPFHQVVAEAEGVPPGELHLAMCLERRGPAALAPEDHPWACALESQLRDRAGLDCSLHIGNGRQAVAVLPRRSWPAG